MPQPTSKHHAEWLSLLEISGPFLSMPVLTNAFPQGLEELPDGLARSLRADYAFWQEKAKDPAVHTAWIRLVLESLLGYEGVDTASPVLLSGQAISAGWKAEFPEHEETLRPDMMLVEPGSRAPHLLIQVFPPSQNLEKAVQGSRWQASVSTRMMELLHATEVKLGLVTNGEQWMLVHAPRGETTGFATWYAGLWFDERITLQAFQSLLGVRRFFGVAEEQTLERLLTSSANDQQETTDQLGLQVRHAVEILIQKIDEADQTSGGALLTGIGVDAENVPTLLYETSLTVMMRLVFLLSAEERKLLPLDDSLYAENYAVSTLRAQLRELADQQGEEVLERRFDAWSRLLAIFRAVHGGIRHERLSLPPYGGSLFDPEKYPFLEGRGGSRSALTKTEIPLPVDNRTVLHLLEALQILQVEGEARRLSFRALDVEQIGHVYEGLLDHRAARATEPVLGLRGAKRIEPEITLSALEQAARGKESDLIAWLKDATGRSDSALKNALASDIIQKDADFASRLRSKCADETLFGRLAPFAGLLRLDDFGFPVVILAGSVYVTSGTTRRATGTHYTPRSLTEPVVQHTLEPLVYVGPAEGLPREQWRLRPPQELLELKICDMAMGSGGFLVQVVRYMAERLVESMQKDEFTLRVQNSEQNSSFFMLNSALTAEDTLNYARRLVAERCIYGVDKNPLAVEIAKLSLWLVTLAKDFPFTFVDHALKCGDSLVGASADDFERWAHVIRDATLLLWKDEILGNLNTARQKRKELEGFVVRDVQDAARKAELLREAEAATERVRRGADLLTGARLLGLKGQELESLLDRLAMDYGAGLLFDAIDPAKHYDAARALQAAQKERAFHWEFAFPEVFARGGFSAFVGNPPFLGGLRISTMNGENYLRYLRAAYPASSGTADLCAFFFLQSFGFMRNNGTLGLIATNTISQGDTRLTSLDNIVKKGGSIFRAAPSTAWPGDAKVFVAIAHIFNGDFKGEKFLDKKTVSAISSLLDEQSIHGDPKTLLQNVNQGFIGAYVLGMGFVLEPDDARDLIARSSKNKDVLFPYLNGEDLNSQPNQEPTRWVINFSNWPLEKAEEYAECIERVRKLVKPERDIVKDGSAHQYWWRFARTKVDLLSAVRMQKRVLVTSCVSRHLAFAFVANSWVYNKNTTVFTFEDANHFAILQSSLYYFWVRKYSSTLKEDINYSPSDCFQNFPFPKDLSGLEDIGERYHETRRQIMLARQAGLTKTYNRFHNPEEQSADIVELRHLHVEMDSAVAAAYGWEELELGHDFHETAQGVRFTISESARRDVLSRLLKLNHERHEEEMKNAELGIENDIPKSRKTGKAKGRNSQGDGQLGLF
jgi:hypothetical protein